MLDKELVNRTQAYSNLYNELKELKNEFCEMVSQEMIQGKHYGKYRSIMDLQQIPKTLRSASFGDFFYWADKNNIKDPRDVEEVELTEEEIRKMEQFSKNFKEKEEHYENERTFFYKKLFPKLKKKKNKEEFKELYHQMPTEYDKYEIYEQNTELFH